MTRFSANLGFLWKELSLPDAIRAAKRAGFDAVECHFPYDVPETEVIAALSETGLPMLGINTIRGEEGEFGLAALPGREEDARAAIDQAISYASRIKAANVHVMAGVSSGATANKTFTSNLAYACHQAEPHGITILIEPLNRYDAPGYFLNRSAQAIHIIEEVAAPNLKLMFDCYHLQLQEGDLTHRLDNLMPLIGHIQFAAVPDRAEPDHGELDYRYIFNVIADLGYTAPLGAEYKPAGSTEEGLGWMQSLRG
jgi:hydroxypyruvate isomerase